MWGFLGDLELGMDKPHMQGCCQGHPGLEVTNSLEQGVRGTGVQCQPGWAPTVDSCSDDVQKCGASPAHTCLPMPAINPQSPPPITVVTFCVNLHVPSNQTCSQALVADLSLSSLTLACSSFSRGMNGDSCTETGLAPGPFRSPDHAGAESSAAV